MNVLTICILVTAPRLNIHSSCIRSHPSEEEKALMHGFPHFETKIVKLLIISQRKQIL